MPAPRLRAFVAVVASALCCSLAPPRMARADSIPCGPVERGVISVDGILDDWQGVDGAAAGGGSADFSFTAKCNYDTATLYLVIDVTDDVLVRTRARGGATPKRRGAGRPAARVPARSVRARGRVAAGRAAAGSPTGDLTGPPEDHVEIDFADGAALERLLIYPGDAQRDIPRRAFFASGRPTTGLDVEDSLQAAGWAIELRMPLDKVPGWSPGAPAPALAVAAFDADSPKKPRIEKTLRTSPARSENALGATPVGESHDLLAAFLADRGLGAGDVTFDRPVRVGDKGRARAVLAGKDLAFIDDEWTYLELPVASPRDVLEVSARDLAGDGHDAVLVRYLEAEAGGTREVLAAYRKTGGGIERGFAAEVGKSAGARRVACKVSYVPRGPATDLVLEAAPAAGFTEATYDRPLAGDIVPILLPWSNDKRARFQFKGDHYVRAE